MWKLHLENHFTSHTIGISDQADKLLRQKFLF